MHQRMCTCSCMYPHICFFEDPAKSLRRGGGSRWISLMYKDARANLDFFLDPLYFRNLLHETKSWASQSFLLFVRLFPYWLRRSWCLPRAQLATWSHSGSLFVPVVLMDSTMHSSFIHSSAKYLLLCVRWPLHSYVFSLEQMLWGLCNGRTGTWLFDYLSTLSLIDVGLKSAEI